MGEHHILAFYFKILAVVQVPLGNLLEMQNFRPQTISTESEPAYFSNFFKGSICTRHLRSPTQSHILIFQSSFDAMVPAIVAQQTGPRAFL